MAAEPSKPTEHEDDHGQKKRLIICCDGTWQSADKPESNVSSNVTHMCRALAHEGKNDKGDAEQQIVYYQSGVGTDVFSKVSASYSGGSGAGLAENVVEAYNFLCLNYQCGDSIYVFGFSRGAYTARALAGMVCKLGILKKAYLDHFPTIYRNYQLKERKNLKAQLATLVANHGEIHTAYGEYTQGLKKIDPTFGDVGQHDRDVKIQVVGVWDTVGSLGVPDTNFLGGVGDYIREWWNQDYKFHETGISDRIANAFHALALDEHRAPFSPSLWHKHKPCLRDCKEKHHDPFFCEGCSESHPHHTSESVAKTNLNQCWFPGCHINVGGGSDSTNGDEGQLSDLAFAWMVDLCKQSDNPLAFDEDYLKQFAQKHIAIATKLKTAALGRDKTLKNDIIPLPAWAHPQVTPIIDSFESMPMGGSRTRFPGEYGQQNEEVKVGTKNWTNKYEAHVTNEYIHPAVRIRLQNTIPSWRSSDGKGYPRAWGSPVQQLALRHFRVGELTEVPNAKDYPGRDETAETRKTNEGSGFVWYKFAQDIRNIPKDEISNPEVPLIISEWKVGSGNPDSFEKRLLQDYPETLIKLENPTKDPESNKFPKDLPFGEDYANTYWGATKSNVVGASEIAYKATRNVGYSIGTNTWDGIKWISQKVGLVSKEEPKV